VLLNAEIKGTWEAVREKGHISEKLKSLQPAYRRKMIHLDDKRGYRKSGSARKSRCPVTRLNVQVPTVLQPGATKQSGNTIKYFGSDIGVCSRRTQGPRRAALRPSLHLDTT